MSESSMFCIADTLKALRDKKNELQAKLKDLQVRIDETEAALIEMMTTEECSGFDRSGSRFSLVIKEYPGAVPEKREELYAQMRLHDLGHLFTINNQTLSGTVKELKSNNNDILPKWLEGLIRIYEKPSIRVTKSK